MTSTVLGIPAPGTTVVVVEDNADSREMLCSMLRDAGLVCHGAADGQSALRLIDDVSPDVVILDVGLPGMDGLEVARRIRANPRHARDPPDCADRLRSVRAIVRRPHRRALTTIWSSPYIRPNYCGCSQRPGPRDGSLFEQLT